VEAGRTRRHDERQDSRGGSRADGDARARRRILGRRGPADGRMDMGVATELGSLAFFVALWVSMMAAMMLPGAVPAVLRRAHASGRVRDPYHAGTQILSYSRRRARTGHCRTTPATGLGTDGCPSGRVGRDLIAASICANRQPIPRGRGDASILETGGDGPLESTWKTCASLRFAAIRPSSGTPQPRTGLLGPRAVRNTSDGNIQT
jgi:hypothetical protein